MRCPVCRSPAVVKDSRPTHQGNSVRRRRACLKCGEQWTTVEISLGAMKVLQEIDVLSSAVRDLVAKLDVLSHEAALLVEDYEIDKLKDEVRRRRRQHKVDRATRLYADPPDQL